MSSSTTQQKKNASNGANDQDANVNLFARELQKKIRNKQKKIEKIVELEQKVKSKEIVANAEQKQKIASKPDVEAEIAEVKGYLDLFVISQAENAAADNKQKKQHTKELANAKKSTVTAIANMITMHTMQQCSQPIPSELEEGVKHFSECLNKMLCKGQGSLQWRQQRDCFIQCWTKLASGSQDNVPHTDTSFEELG